MTIKIVSIKYYAFLMIIKYFGYAFIFVGIFFIGGYHRARGVIEVYKLPNWTYIIAILVVVFGVISSIFFLTKKDYYC